MVNKCKVEGCTDARSEGDYCGYHRDVFEYLDTLRESGETNMFAAPRYIIEDFGVDRNEARNVFNAWIAQFGS